MSAIQNYLAEHHSLLDAMPIGASLVQAGKLAYLNPVGLALLEGASSFEGTDITRVFQPVDEMPLTAPGPILAEVQLDSNRRRFKVRYQRALTDEIDLLLFESFEEDVALTEAHSRFVSVVSHEFRTPLTSIKGFADTMLAYGERLEPEQQRRFVAIIKDQADRLTRMVENLLTVSRLGARRMGVTLRAVPLEKVLTRVLHTLQGKGATAERFDVKLSASLPPLWADPDQLEQILLNLIDNAVKYSPGGEPVTIEALLDPKRDDFMRIGIQDRGIGIPPERLPTIFSQFSRIDNPLTRQVEGTGLGLYIAKSLAVTMGGTLTAESEPGQGTTFILHLPVATPERQMQYQQRQTREDATPLASTSTARLDDEAADTSGNPGPQRGR